MKQGSWIYSKWGVNRYEPNIEAYYNEIKTSIYNSISYSERQEKIDEITMKYNPVALYFVLENGNIVYI
jgi:hypothetical protein